jgi:hypothetical protein
MLISILILSFSSAVFELKNIQVCFYSQQGTLLSIDENKIFNSQQSVENIISSANFEYGKLMFLQQKDKYLLNLERNNAYLETLNLQAVFPNTFVVSVRERYSVFYFSTDSQLYLLDKDYKILDIVSTADTTDLIPINFQKDDETMSFFSFFSLSSLAISVCQFLSENNRVFQNIQVYSLLSSFGLLSAVKSLDVIQQDGTVLLEIPTKSSSYGVLLRVQNVLENFEKKFKKLVSALLTLKENESVKTTYGTLEIDENCNCFWHNL